VVSHIGKSSSLTKTKKTALCLFSFHFNMRGKIPLELPPNLIDLHTHSLVRFWPYFSSHISLQLHLLSFSHPKPSTLPSANLVSLSLSLSLSEPHSLSTSSHGRSPLWYYIQIRQSEALNIAQTSLPLHCHTSLFSMLHDQIFDDLAGFLVDPS